MENQDPNKVNVIPSWKPQLGMKFDDLDEAWHFWRYYGGRVGFSVRKRFTNRSKFDGVVTSCRYVCFKEGKKSADKRDNLTQIGRAEIRTDCQVRMSLTIDREVGNYEVYDLCLEHNHMLQLPEACHLLPSQRRISKVQAFENALISATKQVKELLGACTTNAEERCHVQVTQTSNETSSAAQVTQTSNELLSAARLKKKEVEKKGSKRKKGFLERQHKRTRKTPSATSARKEREDFSISQQEEKEKVISQTSSVKKVVSKKSAKRAKPIPNEASSEKYEFMGSFTDLLTAPIVEDIDADPF